MAIGIFSDKERRPSPKQIGQALDTKRPLWDRLLKFIASNYQIPPDLSYGGQNYGWNIHVRSSRDVKDVEQLLQIKKPPRSLSRE